MPAAWPRCSLRGTCGTTGRSPSRCFTRKLVSSVGAQRFLWEIRISGRLLHPHLLPLLDSGEEAGLLYYVAPYVAGGSWRERLARDGPLDFAETLRIAREVGRGLEFAHHEGFVHRDVKPANILLADTHAILADFGIARPYVSPVAFATICLGLGEVDEAMTWSERCVDERRGWPVYFRVNPVVDPLRGNPRFVALIERMGLAG